MTPFRHESLKQLTDQQVRFAPPAVRLEQLRNAETLLGEVDVLKEYPYQFVCFRITDFRSDANRDGADHRPRSGSRPRPVHSRSRPLDAGHADRRSERAGADAGRVQPQAERDDQDDQSLAQARV